MLPGEPLIMTVCVLCAGVEAVCAEAAPRTTARMTAIKAEFRPTSSSQVLLVTGSMNMVSSVPADSILNFRVGLRPYLGVPARFSWFGRRICNAVPGVEQRQGYRGTVSLGHSQRYRLRGF